MQRHYCSLVEYKSARRWFIIRRSKKQNDEGYWLGIQVILPTCFLAFQFGRESEMNKCGKRFQETIFNIEMIFSPYYCLIRAGRNTVERRNSAFQATKYRKIGKEFSFSKTRTESDYPGSGNGTTKLNYERHHTVLKALQNLFQYFSERTFLSTDLTVNF